MPCTYSMAVDPSSGSIVDTWMEPAGAHGDRLRREVELVESLKLAGTSESSVNVPVVYSGLVLSNQNPTLVPRSAPEYGAEILLRTGRRGILRDADGKVFLFALRLRGKQQGSAAISQSRER